MIFNRDLLFIHVPKAGGMAVSKYLLQILPRPVYYSRPLSDSEVSESGIVDIDGIRHETLAEAKEIVERYGFALEQFAAIVAVLRNPYALEVSRFAYLQKGHPWDSGHNQDLALEDDFEAFAIHSVDHAGTTRPIQAYFEIDGVIPKNLRVLHCESLADELKQLLDTLELGSDLPLPRDNESSHASHEQYYSAAAEAAVYQRYRWIFDQGFYPRIDRDTFLFVDHPPITGRAIPIEGPVLQYGRSIGFWHDGWVDECLEFRIKVVRTIHGIVVEGSIVHEYDTKLILGLEIDDQWVYSEPLERGNFRWQVSCHIDLGRRLKVQLRPSATFCPQELGISRDVRRLSFLLKMFHFIDSAEMQS